MLELDNIHYLSKSFLINVCLSSVSCLLQKFISDEINFQNLPSSDRDNIALSFLLLYFLSPMNEISLIKALFTH